MLAAVDRAVARNVSPGEVMADANRGWNLGCPRCGRDVHLVRDVRHPYFSHEVGVPATSCRLRNTNPSGPSGEERATVEEEEWCCPGCGQSAGEAESGFDPSECIMCGEVVCGDCYKNCDACTESICDECDHEEWSCATCGDNSCADSEEGGRDDQYKCACGELHCESCVHQQLEPCIVCKAKACSNEECYICGERVCGNCFPKHEEQHEAEDAV